MISKTEIAELKSIYNATLDSLTYRNAVDAQRTKDIRLAAAVPKLIEAVEKMKAVVKAAKAFGDSHPIPIICPDCADTGQFAELLVALCELEEVYAPEEK